MFVLPANNVRDLAAADLLVSFLDNNTDEEFQLPAATPDRASDRVQPTECPRILWHGSIMGSNCLPWEDGKTAKWKTSSSSLQPQVTVCSVCVCSPCWSVRWMPFPPRQQMSRDFINPSTSLSRFSCRNKLTNAPACAHKFLVWVASYECTKWNVSSLCALGYSPIFGKAKPKGRRVAVHVRSN